MYNFIILANIIDNVFFNHYIYTVILKKARIMKLISGSIFYCLLCSFFCNASDLTQKKWSWPVATALGLKISSKQKDYQTKTTLPSKSTTQNPLNTNLPKHPSDEWAIIEKEIATTKRTPSPIIREDERDGSIIDYPQQDQTQETPSLTKTYPKLPDLLQVEIMAAQILPKTSRPLTPFQIHKPTEQINSSKTELATPTTTPPSSPLAAIIESMVIKHQPQSSPSAQFSYEDELSRKPTPRSDIRELNHDKIEQNDINQSFWEHVWQGCCPCLPAHTNQESKKKNDDTETIIKYINAGDYRSALEHLDSSFLDNERF